jgi:hypothetical protein
MSAAQQNAFAQALRALTVDADGNIKGPVTKDSIRLATQIAGRLDKEGFPGPAKTIRALASKAAKMVPSPPPEEEIPMPPQMSPELQKRVQRMLQNERDPAKLAKLIGALKPYAKTSEGRQAIRLIKALIVQIEIEEAQLEALEKTAEVVNTPTGKEELPDLEEDKGSILDTPEVIDVPDEPEPQPAPPPKTPVQQAAEKMGAHLKSVQRRDGMPGAKGSEDTSIVARFQSMAGLGADGKAGPGTLGKAVTLGLGNIPLVMYWPRGSSRSSVQIYRDTLRRLAGEAEAQGHKELANEIRMAANNETGQGGIAEYGPALV